MDTPATSRVALLDEAGEVVNVIVVALDGEFVPEAGQTAHVLAEDSNVGPGWKLEGGEFVAPPSPPSEPAGPVLPNVLHLQEQIDMLILEQLLAE